MDLPGDVGGRQRVPLVRGGGARREGDADHLTGEVDLVPREKNRVGDTIVNANVGFVIYLRGAS